MAEPEVTDEMVTAAMRAFERMSSVLRYREKDKWHSCDIMGMRDAIRAALTSLPEGWQMVPVTPTYEMQETAYGSSLAPEGPMSVEFVKINTAIWKDMLKAAPPLTATTSHKAEPQ